ncbi:MAG: alpha-amylase family glycosyl hydrolase, partial [Candidatus Binatia bacterium]
WWRSGVLYQIYVRSFADSNGDGIGDLPGILGRLDYLERLGIDAVWLSPVCVSPDEDWGYDVSDYCAVHRDLGTLADLDRLIGEAGRRGIRVILDLVPNHTSDRHPWFLDARSSRTARRRDWYVWADPRPGGAPPNNWSSGFGGPAWTLDEATGQFYLHNHLASQPDLNWWNPEVREAFDDILRFWFDRGVAGLRIDVCHMIVKDRELRDNPPATEDDPPFIRFLGQRQTYNSDRPEVHEVLRRWRRIADRYDPARLLLGETYVFDVGRMAAFYGREDELDLAFNMPFVYSGFDAEGLRGIVEATERTLPEAAWPAWTASNHDAGRFPTRWCGGDPAKAKCALLLLLALSGTPVLYYGDEIGMPEKLLEPTSLRDPVGKRYWPASMGRDPGRTPMQWSAGPGAGFTTPEATPWLPIGDAGLCNVDAQERDRDSVLHFCRELIALRRSMPDLLSGRYVRLPSPPGTWAFRRGDRVSVALNLSPDETVVEGIAGIVRAATRGARRGEALFGRLRLGAAEAVVAENSVSAL